ncbi:MAG: hypothetical protein LQ341_000538 [Variospora aurantia]|nr:MAG: hypothetical protein LQ341_000538 [Variospora aurantia]
MAEDQHTTSPKPPAGNDEMSAEVDEPPDHRIRFARISPFIKPPYPRKSLPHASKASLLTQGLLTSPVSLPYSDAEPPFLTSDGGLTSPARTNSPSPPSPAPDASGLEFTTPHEFVASNTKVPPRFSALSLATDRVDGSPVTGVEAGLGRKRCIKFACGRQAPGQSEDSHAAQPYAAVNEAPQSAAPPKRRCMLKFACPMKTASEIPAKQNFSSDAPVHRYTASSRCTSDRSASIPCAESRQHHESEPTLTRVPMPAVSKATDAEAMGKTVEFNRPDLEGSEATRFHEFAGPYNGEDEWVNEQTAYRKKITINDTLQKENAIRKIAEEAEEEAILEEEAEEEIYDDLEGLSDCLSAGEGSSDAGNESDNEEGFAESDDGSETGSDFHFWTPGLTTAATSADHLELFRPTAPRASSNSSIESIIRVKASGKGPGHTIHHGHNGFRTKPVKMRPRTPDLPDSTDFVCGTLDEDRPLENAYMSCLEERKRSKHPVIPQDIDPSFPTSDLEADGNEEADNASSLASDEPQWFMDRPNRSDDELVPHRRQPLSRRNTKSPMPSPKRMWSRPPQRRSGARQPALAPVASANMGEGSSPNLPSSSEDMLNDRVQQPSTSPGTLPRRPRVMVPHLPRQGFLTHSSSLPRTPNPFWAPCRQWPRLSPTAQSPTASSQKGKAPNTRSRGPVDIVTGLEQKRQRHKEKYWRQHWRNGGKEKERRCQPGKGAERMRELGLEMAGKNNGQLPQPHLMLSI